MPHFGIFSCSLQERIPSYIKFLKPRLMKTSIKLQSIHCKCDQCEKITNNNETAKERAKNDEQTPHLCHQQQVVKSNNG